MSLYLETDVQPEVPCHGCNGSGVQYADRGGGCPEPDYCDECGGIGACGVGSQMATLAHNLAIAGALKWSFDLGWDRGNDAERYRPRDNPSWIPNVDGKPAP